MTFAAPQWLLLAVVILVGHGVFPQLGLRRPLRALIALLLVLAAADLQFSSRSPGLDLWVVLDRSDSAAEVVAAGLPEWQAILRKEAGNQDRIRWVEFGAEPQVSEDDPSPQFEGDTTESNLGLALRATVAAMDPSRAHRVLVLSDGYGTDSLRDLRAAYHDAEAAIDLRLLSPERGPDLSVQRLSAPTQVEEGEPVMLEAFMQGSLRGSVPFVVQRDGQTIHEGNVVMTDRGAQVRLVDRPRRPGAHRYSVRLRDPRDTAPGNDEQQTWVQVEGGAQVILLTSYPEGPLAKVLKVAGLDVEVVSDPAAMHVGKLFGARALIMEDVPAHRLARDFLQALPFWVQEQGGGLWMIGGRFAFGSGGYFESPIDPLLPVSMELRQEHHKLAVALAIVLDRSGSMNAQVSSPQGMVTKMAMANDGAARAVELLGDRDQVAVLAVDSEAHVVVPRIALSSAREEVLDSLRRINSMGGGIYVYEGLSVAWQQLKDAPVGRRHIILFSDAADSEAPGEYKRLLKTMKKAGATVSVIGLGGPEDVDAALLKDIAERGQGRIFFTNVAGDLPALFAQETVAVARSVFVTEPAAVAETAGWLEIAPQALQWPPIIDAYNLSYARPGATVAAQTRDEQAAPLVAFWRRGRGRVAAVCFPVAGEGSTEVRAWAGYGDFVTSLSRWLAGDVVPAGVALKHQVVGKSLHVELLHDETWDSVIAKQAPRLAIVRAPGADAEEVTWRRMGPGRWSTVLELPRQGYLRGAVQVGKATLALGPLSAGGGLEHRRDAKMRSALVALSGGTGGQARTRLADVFRAPRPPRFKSLRGLLISLWLLLFTLEALLAQTGMRWPQWARPRWPAVTWVRRSPGPSKLAPPADRAETPPVAVAQPPDEEGQRRRSRLERAKRR